MSRLMRLLVRAYLPLVARHTLIDGATRAARRPGPSSTAYREGSPSHSATDAAGRLRRADAERTASLAA